MLEAVIFDFDGTVGDTLPLCIAAFKAAIEPLTKKELTAKEIIATFGPSEEGTIRQLVPQYYDQAFASYLKYYEELHYLCPEPFNGIKEIVQWLKNNGIVAALVTGKSAKSCKISMVQYQMCESFDMIETGSPVKQRKIEGIQNVINAYGLNPENVYYVGDAAGDITCARKAGVKALSAAWADTADVNELQACCPDRLLSSVEELQKFLKDLR